MRDFQTVAQLQDSSDMKSSLIKDLTNCLAWRNKDTEELHDALTWAISVIEIAEQHAPKIDWSIGHFGRKNLAKKILKRTQNIKSSPLKEPQEP